MALDYPKKKRYDKSTIESIKKTDRNEKGVSK